MRIYSNLTVIRSMGTIQIITWYAFNNATWESVLVRIPQYFYCVLITIPVTTSNYHSWLSNLVRLSANDHSKHGNLVNVKKGAEINTWIRLISTRIMSPTFTNFIYWAAIDELPLSWWAIGCKTTTIEIDMTCLFRLVDNYKRKETMPGSLLWSIL